MTCTVHSLVHLKAGPGKALCFVIEAWGSPAAPGELLVLDEAEVTCPACLEWRHA